MNDSKQPFVSVVTPVYNCESYLAECIESVRRQTYQNWEYTIIDNRSTDRSKEIAEYYAAMDPRISVYHNSSFLDVIANHNHALRLISSESKYCKLVFADDWLFPECIEKMVALAERYPSIGIVGAYAIRGTHLMWEGLPYSDGIIPGRAICRLKLKEGIHVFGTGTSTLFRSDSIRSRTDFYNEANLHADTEACLEILKTRDYGFVHQILVYMREREGLTSFSRRMNTYLPAQVYELQRFGHVYLTQRELKVAQKSVLRRYYMFLAKSFFLRRERAFWQFHCAKLRDLGHPMSLARLFVALLTWVADWVFNPVHAIQGAYTRRKAQQEHEPVSEELGISRIQELG